jgi:NTE family protein
MATKKARKRARPAAPAVRSPGKGPKRVNVALQGGGSHGAFVWGVLDKFLEDGRLEIEGLSGTSAGSMNAVAYAYGKLMGGPDGARQTLHDFWKRLSDSGGLFGAMQKPPWNNYWKMFSGDRTLPLKMFKMLTGSMSPYQWNPQNVNPLRDALEASVDFEALNNSKDTKLFLCATNVRTGKARVFYTHEVTSEVVIASACLPNIFQAPVIDGDPYWDGGYIGNPVLYPLFYHTVSCDVIILHVNPIERPGIPMSPPEIDNRVNEIAFNSSLMKELRAVAFVQKMLAEGWIKDEYKNKLKNVLIHSVRSDKALSHLGAATKFTVDWDFLTDLRDLGRESAAQWLEENYKDVGHRATVDLYHEFL